MPQENIEKFCPKNENEWREWLRENHDSRASIWLVYYKSSSASHNLSWSQAVDQALCFGWIDSTKKTIDEERFMQYFCKRKAKSNWSKINKEKVESLEKSGLMEQAGRDSINLAKENGSWTLLDSVEALITPEDLEIKFQKSPKAKAYYLGLSKSLKKGVIYWIISAKRPETRAKRIEALTKSMALKSLPNHFT